MNEKKTAVKICGITSENEISFLVENGVDYMGMVIDCPKSKRNMDIAAAEGLVLKAAALSRGGIKTVAVVVSPELEDVYKLADIGFSIIQIHGEIPENIERVFLEYPNLKMWKAFNGKDIEQLQKFIRLDYVEGFVFDAAEPGSGKVFDWQSLRDIDTGGKKLILAGGLMPDNVALAIDTIKPDVVDVSSGVEFEDEEEKKQAEKKYGLKLALKSPDKICNFAKEAEKLPSFEKIS